MPTRNDDRVKLQPLVSQENKRWLQHHVIDLGTDVGTFIDSVLTALRTGVIQLPPHFLEDGSRGGDDE
jgi:hypothetical protein